MKKGFKIKLFLITALMAAVLIVLSACNKDDKELVETVSNYTIDLVLNDDNKTATVKQTVSYCNSYEVELDSVWFHLYANAFRDGARFSPVDSASLEDAYPNGMSYGGIEVTKLQVNGNNAQIVIDGQDDDILAVSLGTKLAPEERTEIYMEYTLTIPNARHRFGYNDNVINLGNFYPIACMYENGQFDTSPYYSNGDPFYSDVANYKVSVTAPVKYTAAMSGSTVESELLDVKKTTASIDLARDFAIILGEFEVKTMAADGCVVNYYYTKDEAPDLSLKIAVDSVKEFNSLFGEYPYMSLSVVETGFLHGGMEYPSLVYISDSCPTAQIYQETIVHEVAHQWWYGVVGNNQVKNSWIDETLAEYSASLFYQNHPEYNVTYESRLAEVQGIYVAYYRNQNEAISTAMNLSLEEYSSSEYTANIYMKGQIMMDTLRIMIGDDAFLAALKSYYKNNTYKIATPDMLIGSFEKASNRELKTFFDKWTTGEVVLYYT